MKLDVVIERAPGDAAAGLDAIEGSPALARLLARGDPLAPPGDDLEHSLASLFGLAPDAAVPNAALLALGEGLDPGAAYWLRADPVCLVPTGSRLALNELPAGSLAHAEAQALGAALRDHLAAHDAVLLTPHPQRWYLRLAAVPDLRTLSPAACAGTLAESDLPSGADGARFRRMITEAQMLLHAHPVNAAREAAGKPPVNAIWPWGGGRLPQAASARYDRVWGDDPLVRGLARVTGARLLPLPIDAIGMFAGAPGESDALLVLRATGPYAALEAAWFAPVHSALTSGTLSEVAIMLWHGRHRFARRVHRLHLRRWWRSTRALAR